MNCSLKDLDMAFQVTIPEKAAEKVFYGLKEEISGYPLFMMGRGIRRESDSAVFTILDSRASLRGKYREEILNTLPSMLVTDRLVEERFGEIQQEESKEVTI